MLPLLLTLLTACWKLDPATLEIEAVAYEPLNAAEAPSDWVISTFEMPFICPDGETTDMFAIYPSSPGGAVPTALLLHSGSFDYIDVPVQSDPISGEHYADPDLRLTREWSLQRAFATLGMHRNEDAQENHQGSLPLALANAGVAMVMPTNCWGDHWHNSGDDAGRANAASEFFTRQGYDAAEYGWGAVEGSNGVTLPFTPDPNALYMFGQGEGGRGVTELISDGAQPDGAMVDSTADDLAIFWENPSVHQARITGLERIWPDGATATDAGAMHNVAPARFPDRFLAVFSQLDARVPASTNAKLIATIDGLGDDTRYDSWDIGISRHVATAGDPALARDAVDFVLGVPSAE